MTNTYPTDCPCGSRCDGHAIGAPEDPGLEWDGIVPRGGHIVDAVSTEGEVIYSDRSPREEWVSAWSESRRLHA